MLCRSRLSDFDEHLENLANFTGHAEFNGKEGGGRGGVYRAGQKKYPLARGFGYRKLFALMADRLSPRLAIVDALGGSGTLARASRLLFPPSEQPYMISSDACVAQIEAAMKECRPCVPQAVQSTLFCDCVADVGFYGYGLHHVPRSERASAVVEAHRYLKRNGRIVLMDFEDGSPTARWYSDGLHLYTETGHECDHFTSHDFHDLLSSAGFREISIGNVYDPFIFDSHSAMEARRVLLSHLVSMFGMVRLSKRDNESDSDYIDRLDATLTPYATFSSVDVAFEPEAMSKFSVRQISPGIFRAEFPRVCLVATAIK